MTKNALILGFSLLLFFAMALSVAFPNIWSGLSGESPGQQLVNNGDTLRAPFDSQPLDEGDEGARYDQPHRSNQQVASWLTETLSKALTVRPQTYDDHIGEMAGYATKAAIDDYRQFMEQTRILPLLRQQNMKMNSFVESRPDIVSRGALRDRYRWLLRVPVTLTFLPQDTVTYENTRPRNERLVVTVQIARVSTETNENGLIMETWDVSRNTGE